MSVLEGGEVGAAAAAARAEQLKKKWRARGALTLSALADFTAATPAERELIPSPETGTPGAPSRAS